MKTTIKATPSSRKRRSGNNGKGTITMAATLTSSSRVVSLTKFCTTCCVALAPTLPPFPGPVTGSSGLLLFLGSSLSFSRLRFVPRPRSMSRNIGKAWGVIMCGAVTASDMSSTVTFLGGPLLSRSLAPLRDVSGEYSTHISPLERPVTIWSAVSDDE
jgi:hypothetical protein